MKTLVLRKSRNLRELPYQSRRRWYMRSGKNVADAWHFRWPLRVSFSSIIMRARVATLGFRMCMSPEPLVIGWHACATRPPRTPGAHLTRDRSRVSACVRRTRRTRGVYVLGLSPAWIPAKCTFIPSPPPAFIYISDGDTDNWIIPKARITPKVDSGSRICFLSTLVLLFTFII